jgi:glycosyltransferase involved in cell wall biosynthesis
MNKKIKILHIIPTLAAGGAEKTVVELVKFIDREVFDVQVLCLRAGGFWEEELRSAKVPYAIIGNLRRPIIFNFFKIIKFIRVAKPDIVHTHLFGADFYGRLAARLAGVKNIISTEQNLNLSEGKFKKLAKYFTAKLAIKIVAASGAIKKYLIEQEGVPADKIEVIYNGVEIEKFLKQNREYNNNRQLVIGSIGRLTHQKGFDYLLEAMVKIDGVKCLIAGVGEEKNSLAEKIKELGLSEKVELVGLKKDVSDFLASLDVFVLPSRWEGFGIVILEAGLSGLPVIASRVDGILEIIDDGQNGLLFMPGNTEELVDKIKSLLVNPAERARLGKNLQQKIQEKFLIQKIVKQYEALYLQVLNKKNIVL